MIATTDPPAQLSEVEAAQWMKLRSHHFDNDNYRAADEKRRSNKRKAQLEIDAK